MALPYDSKKSAFKNLPRSRYPSAPPNYLLGPGGGMSNILSGSDSRGAYSWTEDQMKKIGGRMNPTEFTGDGTSDLRPDEFSNGLESFNLASNQYGGSNPFNQIWGGGGMQDPRREGGAAPGMLSKIGNYIGDNPMDVANLGLNIWGQVNKNKALNQNEQYLGDVRKAMEFDQADVNRRWDLAMGDYKVRQTDQNLHRVAQGGEAHAKVFESV